MFILFLQIFQHFPFIEYWCFVGTPFRETAPTLKSVRRFTIKTFDIFMLNSMDESFKYFKVCIYTIA